MGNSNGAIEKIGTALDEQERTYIWLARKSGVPYKRLLAELKHRRKPLTLEVAIAAGQALGIDLPQLVEVPAA